MGRLWAVWRFLHTCHLRLKQNDQYKVQDTNMSNLLAVGSRRQWSLEGGRAWLWFFGRIPCRGEQVLSLIEHHLGLLGSSNHTSLEGMRHIYILYWYLIIGTILLLLRYLGAIIGRTCDRIAEGKFSLEGADYQVPFSISEWSDLIQIKTQFNKNMICNYSWTSTTSSALVVVSMVVKGASFSPIRIFHSWSQWKGESNRKKFQSSYFSNWNFRGWDKCLWKGRLDKDTTSLTLR